MMMRRRNYSQTKKKHYSKQKSSSVSFLWWIQISLTTTLLLLSTFGCIDGVRADDDNNNKTTLKQKLREKYDELPENGKFAAGAAVGFGVSRVAVKSAVSVVKFAGAAYVTTEVLNAAGVLDNVELSEEHNESANAIKQRALAVASNFRSKVRRHLNPEKLKRLLETDRMATFGVATGAVVGFLI